MRAEIVQDACMHCGRPWDGHTLPASYATAWCPHCEAYRRFETNTYVPKAEAERLRDENEKLREAVAEHQAAILMGARTGYDVGDADEVLWARVSALESDEEDRSDA